MTLRRTFFILSLALIAVSVGGAIGTPFVSFVAETRTWTLHVEPHGISVGHWLDEDEPCALFFHTARAWHWRDYLIPTFHAERLGELDIRIPWGWFLGAGVLGVWWKRPQRVLRPAFPVAADVKACMK